MMKQLLGILAALLLLAAPAFAQPISNPPNRASGASGTVQTSNGAGQNTAGAGTITVANIGATSTDGLLLTNTTSAANGAQQWSPRLHLTGQGWGTTAPASTNVDFIAEVQPVQGTTAAGNLVLSARVGAGSYTAVATIPVSSAARWTVPGGFNSSNATSYFATVFVGTGQTASFGSTADGTMFLENNAGSGFSRLQFGGVSSSFAALQTSATAITAGLADGTAGGSLNASGSLLNTGITTDSTHTDATVCEDTTSHQFYFGSGTLGICLGTSSMRYKHDIAPLDVSLDQLMRLQPISYKLNADHGDPTKTLYGFTAEQMQGVLPQLVGMDAQGRPNTADYLGVVPATVKWLQDEQNEIIVLKDEVTELKNEVRELKRMNVALTSLH